jgi:hypothetical protein
VRVKIEDCYTPSWALLWRCGRSRVRTERYDFDAIEHRERKIIDSGSPFGVALAALRERHAGWPFMDSRLECSVLSAQCSVLSAQCSVLSAQCSVLSAQCSVLSAQCSVLSAQCSVLSAQCSVLSAQCSVLSEK